MKIGCHVSIAQNIWACFERAASVESEVFQIFTQNQRQWRSVQYSAEDIQKFHDLRSEGPYRDVPLVAHASYLINLCAEDEEKLARSRQAFLDELKRCDALGIDFLVIHPGSYGSKTLEWGIDRVAETINLACEQYKPRVQILLESTAGQGSNLGFRFEQLQAIREKALQKEHLAYCLDTCHIFAAGYELETVNGLENTLKEVDKWLGMERVKVWHFNDSMHERGSRRDRHAPIGEGKIGLTPFEILVNDPVFKDTPAILEIPGGMEKFAENIQLLKKLRKGGG
ncbi:deoxyribonuclease IV [Caldithrix abyssi]|uniref:Probable endonuclease 4 n=1 Tax=Caldithrix abyssi DSM 13497 TaxID=880073 RepID=H1XXL7_CALAY|nr:deoxyribonuclease IV [Caldithrix abyssi]APF19230.1 nfo Endonuclease IV [Caldithrix abyssi DSM 13497]EHO43141.1 endonuclease 4 [Caldithrix abyssi DSM 13497]